MKALHRELELKYEMPPDWEPVDVLEDFKKWVWKIPGRFYKRDCSVAVTRYLYTEGPDVYFERADNVVRWREGTGELTVKQRTSMTSTFDRLEVDLHLDNDTEDVLVFLGATGWDKVFTLNKQAHIFWITATLDTGEKIDYTIVFYTVDMDGEPESEKSFVEIEIEKQFSNSDTAMSIFDVLVTELEYWLYEYPNTILPSPSSRSLYEIYSGRTYTMMGASNE